MFFKSRVKIFTAFLLVLMFSSTQVQMATAETTSLLSLKCVDVDSEHFFLSVSMSGFLKVSVFGIPIGFNTASVQVCGYDEDDNAFFDLGTSEIVSNEAEEDGFLFMQAFEQEQGYSAIINEFYPKIDNGNGLISVVAYRLSPKEANNSEMYRIYFKRISDEPANIKIVDENDDIYDDTLPNGASFYYAGSELDYDIVYEGKDFVEGTKPGHHEGKNYSAVINGGEDSENVTDKSDSEKQDDNGKSDNSNKDLEKKFFDVPSEHWAYNAIMSMAEMDIISGYGDGEFKPNQNVSRAEIATIISRAAGFGEEVEENMAFGDIIGSEWFAKYVKAAYKKGVVAGYDDNTFRPNEPVTRQDLCCMLYRAFFKNSEVTDYDLTFNDKQDISEYALDSVRALCARKILSGRENNTFCPKQYATRAEVARVVYMCLNHEGGN